MAAFKFRPKFEEIISKETRFLVEDIQKYSYDAIVPASELLRRSVANVVNLIVIGKRFDYKDRMMDLFDRLSGTDEFEEQSSTFTGYLTNFSKYAPLIKTLPIKYFQAISEAEVLLKQFINEEILRHERNEANENEIPDDLLNHYMKTNSGGDLASIVYNIYTTACEPMKTSLEWLLLLVAANPNVQKGVREEIQQTIGSRRPACSDRKEMKFTESVILESLRFGSLLPLSLPHVAIEETTSDGLLIPKGDHMMINNWALNYDANRWKDAESFEASRFLNDGDMESHHSENVLRSSFGDGESKCPARDLAVEMLFLVLTNLLQNFELNCPIGEELPTHANVKDHLLGPDFLNLSFRAIKQDN